MMGTKRAPTFLLLITGLLMLVGASLMLYFGLYLAGSTTFACARQAPRQINCTLRESVWLGQRRRETSLNQVQGIRLQTTDCDKSVYDASRNQWRTEASRCDEPLLQTSHGEVYIPLPNSVYSQINGFILSTDPTLYLTDNHWLLALILAGLGSLGIVVSGILLQHYKRTQSRFY